MSTDTVNLLLGIAGLLLGFISAYAQLKAITLRVLHLGGSAADKLLARQDAFAKFFIANPSALIAHVARSFVWFIALIFLLSFFRAPHLVGLGLPPWLASVIAFLVPLFPGVVLGSLASTCSLVIQQARRDANGA